MFWGIPSLCLRASLFPVQDQTKELSDIAVIYVTDYYSMKPTDGRKAYYVIESNVFGPMGRELIPFEKEPEAKEFLEF